MHVLTKRAGLGVVAGIFLSSCVTVTYKERLPDAEKPGTERTTVVSFRPVFEQPLESNTVHLAREPGLMRRVLLSPNVVFESSRSSVDEPKVWGPELEGAAGRSAPELQNALGKPVDIGLSSLLMSYLSEPPRRSVLLAPALTKKWDPQWWCVGAKDCVEASWVERLFLLHQRPVARSARSSEEASGSTSLPSDLAVDELPTSALAVRSLGMEFKTLPLVAERTPQGELEVRPRHFKDERSECPAMSVTLPVVTFQAELVSMRDGRILARVDEMRLPRPTQPLAVPIAANRFEAVRRRDHTEFREGRPVGEGYEYIATWMEHDIRCERAVAAYNLLFEDLRRNLERSTGTLVSELFQSALGPLYGPPADGRPRTTPDLRPVPGPTVEPLGQRSGE